MQHWALKNLAPTYLSPYPPYSLLLGKSLFSSLTMYSSPETHLRRLRRPNTHLLQRLSWPHSHVSELRLRPVSLPTQTIYSTDVSILLFSLWAPCSNPMLLEWQAFNKYWRMTEYVEFESESQWSTPENKSEIRATKIKKTPLRSPRQFYIFSIVTNFSVYATSHIPEITSIILRISRPLKAILLFSLFFVAKILCIFIHRKTCPSVTQFSMLMSPRPSPAPLLLHSTPLPQMVLRLIPCCKFSEPGLQLGLF